MKNVFNYAPYLVCFFKKDKLAELTFFVTDRCNFKCPFCFNQNRTGNEELSLEEIEKFSKSAGPLLRLLISGGEPFLRKELTQICKIFIRQNHLVHLTIPTNGFYTADIVATAREICSFAPETYVNISLSLDELGERRDQLVGVPGAFQKLMDTHAGLLRLKEHFRNLFVGVITTQCVENQNELMKIYRFAKDQLKTDNFAFSFARGSETEGKMPDIGIYKKFAAFLSRENRTQLNFPAAKFYEAKRALVYEALVDAVEKKAYRSPCYAGALRAVVGAAGDVFPCETFMFDGAGAKHRLGNLREADCDFRRIWNAEKTKEVRGWIRDSKCFCSHECDLTVNAMFNLANVPRIFGEVLFGTRHGKGLRHESSTDRR